MRLLFTLLFISLSASGAPKVAIPGLNAVQLDPKVGEFIGEQLGLELDARGVDVITSSEISALIGLERQKQLLACSDENNSCIAELGNALGVDAIIVGDVARLGTRFQLTVKALNAQNGKKLATYTQGASSEEALVDMTKAAAASLSAQLSAATKKPLADRGVQVGMNTADSKIAGAPSGARRFAWIPIAAGGVLLAGGVAAELVAMGKYNTLRNDPPPRFEDATALANEGKSWQTGFAVASSAGLALLAAGGAMYLLGGDDSNAATVLISPTGASVAASFSF